MNLKTVLPVINHSDRSMWIDFLRLIAVFAVVGVHSAVPVVLGFGTAAKKDWWCGNIFDSSLRWCVPVFVMITGALLLNPKRELKILLFYRDKTFKIFIPLLFWSIIYCTLTGMLDFHAHQLINMKQMVINIISGRPYQHLWYLFMLIGLYAVTPFLKRLLQIFSSLQTTVFTLSLITIGMLFALFPQTNYETGNVFLLWSVQFMGYFVLGGVAYKNRFWEQINRNVLTFFYLVSVVMTATLCWWFSTSISLDTGLKFYNYSSPTVFIMAVSVFLLAAKMDRWLTKFNIPHAILNTTLGIYVFHPIVIFVLFYYNFGSNFLSLFTILITCMVSIIISLVTVLLLKRIPFLRMMV